MAESQHDVEALLVDVLLDGAHLRVDRTPHPDCGLGAVRQIQPDVDDRVDAPARIGVGPQLVHPFLGGLRHPVLDQRVGVGRPVLEVVVERAGRNSQPAADLGQLQPAVTEIGQYLQTRFEVRLPGHDGRHGWEH